MAGAYRKYGHNTGRPWEPDEVAFLRKHFAKADWVVILARFPDRSQDGITRKAYALGLKRSWEGRLDWGHIDPLFLELRALRKRLGLTIPAVAKKSGHHKDKLRKYENGTIQPSFWTVRDWAQALGMKIILEPIGYEERLAKHMAKNGQKHGIGWSEAAE